jgi:hypothetical protein
MSACIHTNEDMEGGYYLTPQKLEAVTEYAIMVGCMKCW